MTTQTPDAVREALQKIERAYREWDPDATFASTALAVVSTIAREALAALDSRAGDAGEGDRYTQGYAQGQADAAQFHQWMQDKAWQDTVLMLVHYQTLAERTWLVGHEEAAAKLAEWWRHARVLSGTKTVEDITATPAPAVDAQSMSIAIGAGPARDALADLEQFLTDHSGNEDTTEGMEAEDRAHKAMRFVRRVICAAMDLCDGATDDCTAGRIVTVDGDDFDQLNAALDDAAPAVDGVPAGEDYKLAFEQLAGGLAWMHDCPGLRAYWGQPLADIVNDLIDRAYPNLRNGISRP